MQPTHFELKETSFPFLPKASLYMKSPRPRACPLEYFTANEELKLTTASSTLPKIIAS
jgi:hypothetical protein